MKKIIFFIVSLICLNSNASAQARFFTWETYSDSINWDKYFGEVKDVGIDGLLLRASPAEYKKIIPIANKYGIEVHAWLWIMNNADIAKKHPEWLDYNLQGKSIKDKPAYVEYYKFLNPAIPGVQKAIVKHIKQFAKIKGIKSISLDYCRYVDAILPSSLWKNYNIVQDKVYPEWDYGYHPKMIAEFMKKYNYDPRLQKNVNADSLWLQFRMDYVNKIVDKLVKLAHKNGKEITASPFPTPQMSRKMVRQDWGKWNLDKAFPMIYYGFYNADLNWIINCVKNCVKNAHKGTKIYVGLYVPDFNNETRFNIVDAIKAAMKNGAYGFSIYTFSQLKPEQKQQIKNFIKTQNK